MRRFSAAIMVAALLLATGAPGAAYAGKAPSGPSVEVACVRTATTVRITDVFKNVPKGTHTEQTHVYTPNGILYQTFSSTFVPTRGAYTVMHEMGVTGTWAQTLPGTWTVRVHLDGAYLGQGTFVIE